MNQLSVGTGGDGLLSRESGSFFGLDDVTP